MQLGRAADHSPPSNATVMQEYNYNSTHPLGHTGSVTGSLYLSIWSCIMAQAFQSLTCHGKGWVSIPGWSLWEFLWGKWNWLRLFFGHFGFPLSDDSPLALHIHIPFIYHRNHYIILAIQHHHQHRHHTRLLLQFTV